MYKFSGYDFLTPSPWIRIPGNLSDIWAAADGSVWGVNRNGNIYRYVGDRQD
ncbi:tectonin domain-containing protein [Streptomyces bacillaris]|uniref:tectonin domain-containing protein n=1 Tax=Streptomyces bacillaris TaxID=68179 RepID=UPI003F4D33D9